MDPSSLIAAIKDVPLPAAVVDLEAFDANIRTVADTVGKMSVRVASKSIRVPHLLRRVLDHGAPYKGIMTYSATETRLLAEDGFDDFLLAYPTLQSSDLSELRSAHEKNKTVRMVVDGVEAIARAAEIMK